MMFWPALRWRRSVFRKSWGTQKSRKRPLRQISIPCSCRWLHSRCWALHVSSDSATPAILAATLVTVAVPRSPEYVALTALVVLVVAVMLLLAYFFRLAFLADFLSRSALMAC